MLNTYIIVVLIQTIKMESINTKISNCILIIDAFKYSSILNLSNLCKRKIIFINSYDSILLGQKGIIIKKSFILVN
jgi:hypothetical protein